MLRKVGMMKTVGQYPARHAEIDLDGQVITLSGKKIQNRHA